MSATFLRSADCSSRRHAALVRSTPSAQLAAISCAIKPESRMEAFSRLRSSDSRLDSRLASDALCRMAFPYAFARVRVSWRKSSFVLLSALFMSVAMAMTATTTNRSVLE